MNTEKLNITELAGSPVACGERYGQEFATRIIAYCSQELQPNPRKLAYARRCWKVVEEFAPASAAFMLGMAQGANLSIDYVTLVSLADEISHQPHCTAFAARGKATRGGKTIVAMNWDAGVGVYPWPGLVRMRAKGDAVTACYHYPGLWASAGVNEAGMALMWTGGGYFPKVAPVVGMPTYVLIAEILRRKSVKDSLKYLGETKHAGCFMFFLADAHGDTAVVEAVPGKSETVNGSDTLSRGNHFLCRSILRCGKQGAPPSRVKDSTVPRTERMAELMERHRGHITPELARKIMTDRDGATGWIHQWPDADDGMPKSFVTIDSLFAVCEDQTLWTARGGRVPGPWQPLRAK